MRRAPILFGARSRPVGGHPRMADLGPAVAVGYQRNERIRNCLRSRAARACWGLTRSRSAFASASSRRNSARLRRRSASAASGPRPPTHPWPGPRSGPDTRSSSPRSSRSSDIGATPVRVALGWVSGRACVRIGCVYPHGATARVRRVRRAPGPGPPACLPLCVAYGYGAGVAISSLAVFPSARC